MIFQSLATPTTIQSNELMLVYFFMLHVVVAVIVVPNCSFRVLADDVCFAIESGICMRQCCKTERGFILHIADNFGQVGMNLIR